MALSPGDSLGPYEIVAPLGAGGMGEVYRARDGRAARDVAVKVLPADVRGDAERLRRFALEARAASTLDHPNIVAVLDFDMKAATPFIVTELLDGMTLREHLESSSRDAGGMAIDEAISIARQLASGLASAHANGIVHRDIKPENLFLCADGRLAILDFGLGRATVPTSGGGAPSRGLTIGLDEDTGTGAVVGTISYMAPEQLTGRSVDHRADLFAFGLVLHELLTGRRTFVGDTPVERAYAILNDPPPPLPSTVPRALRALVERCLAKAADARPASADEVLAVLDGLGRALSEGTPPTPVPRAAPP
ncbi:serine/threonine protein kinase, partial [Myxococcota bacterium]|nr:serine/threonine protein kinase [Myxococcota bacterium]